jgi:hypothetical protein
VAIITKAHMLRIKGMGTEKCSGMMALFIKVSGNLENNTAMDH